MHELCIIINQEIMHEMYSNVSFHICKHCDSSSLVSHLSGWWTSVELAGEHVTVAEGICPV